MSVSFNPGGGFSNFAVDTQMGGPQFQDSLKDKTNEDLIKMLGQDNLSPLAKLAIGKELEERMNAKGAEETGGGGGESGGGDKLKDLLKKLQDGTITSEELKQLSGMLGVDVAELEKIKGKGAEGQHTPEPDITGG